MRRMDGWAIEVTYSPDDSGYWATAIGADMGDAYETEIYPREQDALDKLARFTSAHPAPDYRRK